MKHHLICGILVSAFMAMGCGPALVCQDPVNGSWAYYAGRDQKTQKDVEQGMVYMGRDKKPLTPSNKEQRYYATSGFVDGVAVVARCKHRDETQRCTDFEMALMDESGRLLNAFGEFQYPQLLVSSEFPPKIIHVDLNDIRETFPLWQGKPDLGAQKTRYILFYNERMVVMQNGVYGFVDRQGRPAVAPRFLAVSDFQDGEARVFSDLGVGHIDLHGQFTPEKYACVLGHENELRRVNVGGRLINYTKDLRTQKGMYISETLKASLMNHPDVGNVCSGGKWGLLDVDNDEIVPPEYTSILSDDSGKYFLAKNDEKSVVGIYDKDGNLLVAPEYQMAYLGDFFFVVQNQEGKYAIMNTSGKRTTEFEYDDFQSLTRTDEIGDYMLSEYAVVQKGGKWGVVAADGTVKVPFEYDVMGPESEQIITYQRGNKWGAVDVDGNIFLSPIYGSIGIFQDGRAPATLAGDDIFVYRDEKSRAAWMEKARLDKERREQENRMAAEESRKRQEELARQRLEEQRKQNALLLSAERDRIQKEIDQLEARIEVLEPRFNVTQDKNMGAELEQLRYERDVLLEKLNTLESAPSSAVKQAAHHVQQPSHTANQSFSR